MNLGTVKWAQWDKTHPENCKNCSSKCAHDCAQLQYTIQHRTLLIISPLTPDNHPSSDVVYPRRRGWVQAGLRVCVAVMTCGTLVNRHTHMGSSWSLQLFGIHPSDLCLNGWLTKHRTTSILTWAPCVLWNSECSITVKMTKYQSSR